MAAPTTVDYKAQFTLNTTPDTFVFTDTTDYAGQGTPLAEVNGVFKVVAPSGGVHYNNVDYTNPDIDVDVSLVNSTTITVPLLGDGTPETGIYTITYSVEWDDGVNPIQIITKPRTFDYCYTAPTVVNNLTVNCIAPLLTSKDNTNYIQTIDSVVVTPTIARTHTLYYPPSLGLAATTSTAETITVGTFYTQTHSSTISSILTYTVNAAFLIVDTVTGGAEIDIDCNNNLCSVFCCVENLYVRMKTAKSVNRTTYEALLEVSKQVGFLLIALKTAYECGDSGQINNLTADILALSDCTADCDCSGDQPALVVGAGDNSITVVAATNGLTIVSTVVSGSTTTYTVGLTSANLTKLNALYNSVVDGGTGITVTPVVSGDTTTYTVALSGTLYSPELVEMRAKLEYSNFASPTIAITNQVVSTNGTNTVAPTIESVGFGTNANWATINNLFKVSAFQTVDNDNYKVHIDSVNMGTRTVPASASSTATAAQVYQSARQLNVELLDLGSDEFYFSFVDPATNVRLTNAAMLKFTEILVNLRIEV